MISRRQFLGAAAAMTTIPLLRSSGFFEQPDGRLGDGRFAARVRKPANALPPGDHTLPLARGRSTLLYVPPTYRAEAPAPFVMCLHGATGAGINQYNRYRKYAEKTGAVVLSPSSEGTTWDAIRGSFNADGTHLDAALAWVFDRVAIDPQRVAIAGFSDGASYALTLGIINGDLFTHAVAFSPGFVVPGAAHGKPKVFIAHGTEDEILPIDQCGRRIARELEREKYSVSFHEFDGPHTMLESMIPVAAEFMGWKA